MIKSYRYILLAAIVLWCTACPKPLSVNDIYPPQALLEKDEAVHFKNSLEWWYFTGHLEDQNGQQYGIEYVFFHFNPRDKHDYMMGNFAISIPQDSSFYYDYRILKRDQLLLGEIPLKLELPYEHEKWQLQGEAGEYQLQAAMIKHPGYSMDLSTTSLTPVWMHGDGSGFQKYGEYATAGYFSYPKLQTSGNLQIAGETKEVTGTLWYDRQWNCIGVYQRQVAWDWMSIQLDHDQGDLMVFKLYHRADNQIVYGGSYLDPQGNNISLGPTDLVMEELEYWKSPDSKISYPVSWKVTVPKLGLDLKVKALFPHQELTLKFNALVKMSYWEGMCQVSGSKNGDPVSGRSYLEITNRKKGSS